jgi:hypothetical protein
MKLASMNKIIVTVIVVILVAGSVFAAPRLTIDESMFDFGYVPQNSVVSYKFWLKSTGDDTLRVLSVKPG